MKNILMTIAFISAILRGVWAIEPTYAENAKQYVQSILSGQNVNFSYKNASSEGNQNPNLVPFVIDNKGNRIYTKYSAFGGVISHAFDSSPKGSTAVIPVIGPVIKYDYCGDAGTTTLSQRVKFANEHPNISSIILMIDSPGGMVDGTATFADVIKASTKPVIAFIDDGMAASAAYWIASYANEIIASQPTDQIGSIGAYSTLADFTGAYEKDGIKIKTVYAPQSTEKNEEHRQAFEHNNIKPAEASIGRIAQEFIDKIKENRSGKININVSDPFKGKIFFADEALKIGLIDSIGNLDFAVNRAQKLASDREKFTLKFNS